MSSSMYERKFTACGQSCTAILVESFGGGVSVSIRLPDGSERPVQGRFFQSDGQAMIAAIDAAEQILGCRQKGDGGN